MAFTIREWRRLRELSQQKMADKCGVHVNTYINWEEHPDKLTIEKARVVAKALGVKFSDIRFCEEAQTA